MCRVRRVSDRAEMERLVDEFVTRGYKIELDGESRTRLKQTDWGDADTHLLLAVLTVWWTLGLANALYAIYKRVTADEVVIRIEEETAERKAAETETREGESRETTRDDAPIEAQKAPNRSWKTPVWLLFQLLSLSIAGLVLLTIFVIQTGQIGLAHVVPTLATLTAAVVFRYVTVYHRFRKALYRQILAVPIAVALAASTLYTVTQLLAVVTLEDLREVFQTEAITIQSSSFLPEWWVVAILVPAGVLLILGSVVPRHLAPYPKPSGLRAIAISPVYFGSVCAFLGLWAVLFVGISIQRVVVVAPIFEELLKFGIALVVGSALFDRSLLARIGVAAVVGTLFGLVEHATTYPAESDALYLFRTLFHTMTTVLSVSTYTYFESQENSRLRWLAPAFPMLVHFFYNTFAILSSILTIILVGSRMTVLTLVYGGLAILVVTSLVVLILLRHRAIHFLHVPLENVISDLV